MDMKQLNVFRRLNELETANLYLQGMLKSTRMEVETLRSGVTILHNAVRRPVVTPKPKPKEIRPQAALDRTRARKAAYARVYYARKRAEKLAVMP